MLHWIFLWIAAAAVFLALDMLWLLWLGRCFYVSEIGDLLRQPPNLGAGIAFYLLYVTGLMIMVIWPAVEARSAMQALIFGGVLGLLAYGTYDLTNLAVMKGFTVKIATIDMIWGTLLTAATAGIAAWIGLFIRQP